MGILLFFVLGGSSSLNPMHSCSINVKSASNSCTCATGDSPSMGERSVLLISYVEFTVVVSSPIPRVDLNVLKKFRRTPLIPKGTVCSILRGVFLLLKRRADRVCRICSWVGRLRLGIRFVYRVEFLIWHILINPSLRQFAGQFGLLNSENN